MNSDISLWLDILDKTKSLMLRACCRELTDDIRRSIFVELEKMERMLTPDQRFYLAFSGMTNVGKSTLLNALLGDSVAPTKNRPWSSTAVEYRYSEEQYEMIVPLEGISTLHRNFSSSAELLDALNNFAVEGSAFQTDRPLVVRLPNDLLRGDVTIVDTPGFGASDGNDEKPLHDEILVSYLQKKAQNLRVFWIVKDNISESSVNFFREHLVSLCSDLIVNLTDDFDEDFKRQFEELYRPAVGYTVRFHYVNARGAVKAGENGDEELLKQSGIASLKSYLSAFSSAEGRTNLVVQDLGELFQGIGDFLYETNLFSCKWVPTDWGTLSMLLQEAGNQKLIDRFQHLKRR